MRAAFWPMGRREKRDPFNPGQQLIRKDGDDGAFDYVTELPEGIYDLILCSSAGSGATGFDGIWFFGSGGSGAAWEGKFKNPHKQQIKIHIGQGAGQEAYFELGGVRMITLTGGANGSFFSGASGGVVTVNSALDVRETRISESSIGNTGNGYTENPSTTAPCTIRPWGDCTADGTGHIQHNGGMLLKYVSLI